MLSKIVGQIDWPAATVLAGLFIGIGICFLVYMITRKTKSEIEIEKMRIQKEHEETQYKLETWRTAEMKKIEQNLITSHRADV